MSAALDDRAGDPTLQIHIYERLDSGAGESSGTLSLRLPVTALCRLNYTPKLNGAIDTCKAVQINREYIVIQSLGLHDWRHPGDPGSFIH